MKKKIFICLTGTVLVLVTINSAFSQISNKSLSNELQLASKETYPFPPVTKGHINDINIRAARDFVKRFDSTSGEKWDKVANGYIVYFEKDSMSFKVSYDKNGNWVYTIRRYTEKNLPFAVRHRIKSSYYDYNISLVTEVETEEQPLVYLIHLTKGEDKTSLKTMLYCDGEIEDVELYKGKWKIIP